MKKRLYRFLIQRIDRIIFRLLVWRHKLLLRLTQEGANSGGSHKMGMRKTILR